MSTCVIDFETRSRCDLLKCGAEVYAEHPSTEVVCLAACDRDHPNDKRVWINPALRRFLPPGTTFQGEVSLETLCTWIRRFDVVEAYNAGFESAMLRSCLKVDLGPISDVAWRGGLVGLPRSLAKACDALGWADGKDMTGHRAMLRLCKPDKNGVWCTDPKVIETVVRYCQQDVEVEARLSRALPPMSSFELAVARTDAKINRRGVGIDVEGCRRTVALLEAVKAIKLKEFKVLTKGQVQSPRQVQALREYLKEVEALDLADLRKNTVTDALKGTIRDGAKEILALRQTLAKSSVDKYAAALNRVCSDGRARGLLIYAGADTGRWAGSGIQPQNMLRPKMSEPEQDAFFKFADDPEAIEMIFGEEPVAVASKACRGMFVAGEGKTFAIADLSAIEGRVLAWLAGEEWVLDAYRDLDAGRSKHDMYVLAYAKSFGVDPASVTKDQRQQGKTLELACGYQGAVGAYSTFCAGFGVPVPEEAKVLELVRAWRKARPATVAFWYGIEKAFIDCIKTGKTTGFGRIVVQPDKIDGKKYVTMRLPSGRKLWYCEPAIDELGRPSYLGVDQKTRRWCRKNTYGGKLVENLTSAASRDILAPALVVNESKGFETVLHVHDEGVAEIPLNRVCEAAMKDYLDSFTQVPAWAQGLPLAAAGFFSRRYRKE